MERARQYSCTKKTKRELSKSLALLAQEKPMNKISVKEVCEKAELSRNAFYTHYPDINGLIEDIENRTLDGIREILAEFNEGTFPHNMLKSIQKLLTLLMDSKETTLMLLENSSSFSFMERLKTLLGSFYSSYFKEFNIAGFEKTYDYFYTFIADGLIGMLRRWLHNPENMSKEMFSYMIYVMIQRLLQVNPEKV